jgi:hypothetical protein
MSMRHLTYMYLPQIFEHKCGVVRGKWEDACDGVERANREALEDARNAWETLKYKTERTNQDRLKKADEHHQVLPRNPQPATCNLQPATRNLTPQA